MNKTFVGLAISLAMSIVVVSCGGASQNAHQLSGLRFRAFVSNPLFPNGTLNSPVLNIVNAKNDVLSGSAISLLGNLAQPQMMFESPSLRFTVVFSPSGNALAVVDNSTEAIATTGSTSTAVPTITLPGFTESLVIAGDNATAYAAVPNAPITGSTPGAVVVMNITTGAITATIPVASAHYLALSPDGNSLLVFSDGSDSMTQIATALIGTNQGGVTTVVPGFDRPVGAIFNSSTAIVFNCGPECGGTQASVAQYSVSTGIGSSVAVPGATFGLLTNNGSTLYVAGTPPGTACPAGTSATRCGTLATVDTASMTVSGSPAIITDGYHNRMQISDDGQLFVGARSCSNVNTSTEIRGCLSILNTTTGAVVIPPALGDATGIQPITGRNVVYVCQGGTFEIFDTTTDQFLVQQQGTVIVGQSFDVKLVDLP